MSQLGERIRALEPLVRLAAASDHLSEAPGKEVDATETRTGQLELQVRLFGPAAHRTKSNE